VLYEEAVRVPLLLRVPFRQNRLARINHPVSHIDIVPTLLDLLGKPRNEALPGRSLLRFDDGAPRAGDDVFIEWHTDPDGPHARTIDTPDGWKMVLFDQDNWSKADYSVVLPAEIDAATEWFAREMRKLPAARAMVHSKVVLVDPLGDHPVVLTGSHNLGPKASGTNDENLLIIRDRRDLAAAYATNIMAVYNQYRWRFRRQSQPESKRWKGLEDNDKWQQGYLRAGSAALREIDFWVGQ
jgi:phosphatidylserine/phosphatidylglycerophosphate/cardiolipin synthase-like enzyme